MTIKQKLPAILLAVALCIMSGCMSSPKLAQPSDYAAIEYVGDIKGHKAPELYDDVKLWIAENFKSAKNVIDYEDRANGIIIGNGTMPGITLSSGLVQIPLSGSFKMKVEVKDDKFRLTFSQFEIVGRPNPVMYVTELEQMKTRLSAFGPQIAEFVKNKKPSEF